MELLSLFLRIAVNGSKEANDEISEVTGNAESSGKKVGSTLEKIGTVATKIAKVIAVAITAVATGVSALATSAIKNYADYEQLVGGVETLFKNSSDKVVEYANNAYKTAGMSANEYMETVTSFSASLLQSLGGDTEQATEKANQAIIDMSDNANKMGTSMESIQNAYQGFAKQNYTMLDNLKLGYGGTKEEMERLLRDAEKLPSAMGRKFDVSNYADIVDAIHLVQVEMGMSGISMEEYNELVQSGAMTQEEAFELLGTTAKEASSTISGSIGMMKSSWTNLVTGMADGTQDMDALVNNFFDSVVTVGDNIIPRVSETLQGIGNAIQKTAPKIIAILPKLLQQVLPQLMQAVTNLIGVLVQVVNEALPTIIQAIVGAFPMVLDALVSIIPTLISGVEIIIEGLIQALPSLVQSLAEALPTLIPQIIDGIVSIFLMLVENFPLILQPIIDSLPDIIISLVNALMDNLPAIIEGLVQLTVAIVEALPQIIMALIDALPTVLMSILEGLWNALPVLLAGIGEILVSIGSAIWELLKNFNPKLAEFFENSVAKIKEIFTPIVEFFSGIWDGIKGAFSSVTTWFKDTFSKAWQAVKDVFSTGGKIFDGIKEGIAGVFKTVVNGLIGGINKVIAVPFTAINTALGKIKDIEILGFTPFDWIEEFSTPQIPLLETGGVLEQGQVGLLEGNGAEAVVPLERNRQWISRVSDEMQTQGINGNDKETKEILRQILALLIDIKEGNSELPELLLDAMANGLKFNINNREFARLVKAVN